MSLASSWRTRKQRLSLKGEICPHCREKLFPPRDICPYCGGPAKTEFAFSGKGAVYSYTTMHTAPQGFEQQTPYIAALIKMTEGPLVTAQLTDVTAEDVYIGMPVEMVTRRISEEGEDGLINYSFKFRPVLANSMQQAAAR
ncbi:MAG: Zn-ribbon domain-containing OB-fold protein [Chloroflexi bacterium]|nr:Zn-ribbon domain-containing OB-fold protein [Chloroflexota bacterium]